MKLCLLMLILSLSCTHQEPYRKIAEDLSEFRSGEVSFGRSLVQIFPSDLNDHTASYYLFVQLKDKEGEFVDAEKRDFSIRTLKGEEIEFKFERVLPGKYYLTIQREEGHPWQELNLYLHGRPLKEQFKVQMVKASRSHSKITNVNNSNGNLVLSLELKDRFNKPLEVPEGPEISLEGEGEVKEVIHTGEGVWEFTVIYPNENQIIYISARANGVFLKRLFRYQHIEK